MALGGKSKKRHFHEVWKRFFSDKYGNDAQRERLSETKRD